MKGKVLLAGVMAAVVTLTSCGGSTSTEGTTGTDTDKTEGSSSESSTSSEPITLTFFDKNTGDAFDNAVAQEITRRTGVKIEIQQPTGNPEEKLNLMQVSGDLPDIVLMDRRSTIVNRYISGGALIPLNDLIDEYGPDIKEMYGDVLTKSRHTDGKNYYLNNWYGIDPDPDRGINMRMDILEELGYGEKAKNGESFTQEEFVDLLTKFKENYTDIDGQSPIPYTVNADHMGTVIGVFKGMYGMKSYYEEDGKLFLDVKDPKYLEMVKFINQLYRDGLLDKEWAVNKEQIYEQKAASGRVFATGGGLPTNANKALAESGDENKQFYMFKVVADGVDPDETTFSPRSSLGWDAIGITTANEHPVETMKLINFLTSEEGQYLLMWGIEGEHWDMEDGVHTPRPEVLQGFKDDWNEYAKETGIRKWTWFLKNGYGTDGTPYDLVTKYEKDEKTQHSIVSMANSVWDTAPYDNLGPEGGTTEALLEQKIIDITDKAFADMVYAESEEALEKVYDNMLNELEANQVSTIEEIYTKNYQDRMELWK